MIERINISSTNIESVGWEAAGADYEEDTMEIEFNWGGIYQYFDVPYEVFENVATGPSPGEYVNRFVKEVYRYRRLY